MEEENGKGKVEEKVKTFFGKAKGFVENIRKSDDVMETGKAVKEGLGLKNAIMKGGMDFCKKYLNDKVTTDNKIGATIGALGEYVGKVVWTKGKQGIAALESFVDGRIEKQREAEETSKETELKLKAIPEIEGAKALIGEYENRTALGKEQVTYQDFVVTVDKTEKDLTVKLKSPIKTVEINYLMKKDDVPGLSTDLEEISKDLLVRLQKLADPSLVNIDKHETMEVSGAREYTVHLTKSKTKCGVVYSPGNQKVGVMLKYAIQAGGK